MEMVLQISIVCCSYLVFVASGYFLNMPHVLYWTSLLKEFKYGAHLNAPNSSTAQTVI